MLNRYLIHIAIVLSALLICSLPATALEPEEVLVIANARVKKSVSLARFYMEKRQIPAENIVLISLTSKETCSRGEYEKKAVPPIRKFLKAHPNIRAMVTMFGVPLRISAPKKIPSEKKMIAAYESQKKALENLLTGNDVKRVKDRQKKHTQLTDLKKTIAGYMRSIDKQAAFDSELALVKKDQFDMNMWLPNPYYLGFRNQKTSVSLDEVMMVSRLDGANEAVVRRIILDTLEAEKNGLSGKAYFDARWKDPGPVKNLTGYALHDKSIHEASRLLSAENRIQVVLNDSTALFRKGESPDTALYCGWYSLAKYIDAFEWQKGSVGYHIASAECTTLRKKDSQVWCKKMLDKGIAATIGPVGEPYVQAFPLPAIFFKYLTEGYLTLAESYIISLPYLSWKMVLIGDPLYRLNIKS